MTEKMATPELGHLTSADYARVYEPAHDTFLFLDALQLDAPFLRARQPHLCIEVGSGSGCVVSFLAKEVLPGLPTSFFATDLNQHAIEATAATARANNVEVNCVCTDLVSGLERAKGKIDVLLFNPPYVPTEDEEVGSKGIEAAWAGGVDGRRVLDRLLPLIPELMSPQGCFYLVVVTENKPEEVMALLASSGFSSKYVLSRVAFNEHLSILRFWRD